MEEEEYEESGLPAAPPNSSTDSLMPDVVDLEGGAFGIMMGKPS